MMTGTFDLGRVTGFSAYEVWKAQPGNENKTEQDFLKFISSGGDWIDFDTTPINFDSVRTYRTYGSTANLNADLTRGSVPGDALSGEFFSGTFMFESHSCRNNLKKSTEYDTIQTMTLFSGSANPDEFAKFVRYGIFDEDDQTFTVQANWTRSDLFIDNKHIVNMASKLAKTFNLKIAGVTKPVDGSKTVEFTKEELGLGGQNSYHFEKIFEGYDDYVEIQNVETDFEEGSIFLIQLTPRVIYPGGGWAEFNPVNGDRYRVPNFLGEINYRTIEDYSMCVLMSSTPLKSSDWSNGDEYVPIRLYANKKSKYKYNRTIKVEKLYMTSTTGPGGVDYGYDIDIKLQVNNDGFMSFISQGDQSVPYITSIWKLTK